MIKQLSISSCCPLPVARGNMAVRTIPAPLKIYNRYIRPAGGLKMRRNPAKKGAKKRCGKKACAPGGKKNKCSRGGSSTFAQPIFRA